LRGKVRFPVRPSWADNWRAGLPTLLVLFRQSLPYALAIFLMYAYTRSDGVLLERFCGKGHAEVYAGAFRVLDACNMLGYLFASLLLPMFARMEKRGDSARPLVGLSFRLIWAASITLAAAICFARRELLEIMMPAQASAYRWDTLGVLIWAFVPFSATNIFSTLLTAQGHLRAALRYFALGIALNFGLNALLMPQAQALGAAFAAVLTQGFVAVAMIWLSLRRFGWRPRPATLGQFAGFAVFILVADFLLFEYSALGWPLNMAIALALGPLGLLIFRWVKFSQLASLKK
jgi:O-antigen/teichoic acid export membrane protein